MTDSILDSVAFFQNDALKKNKRIIIGIDSTFVTGLPLKNDLEKIDNPLIKEFSEMRAKNSNSKDFIILNDVSILGTEKHLDFLVIRIQKISAISLDD